jgi:hypothetical protein
MVTAADTRKIRGYELAREEAVRALDYQRAALDSLRSRVGLLLSAGAIATSFLGGQALKTEANAWTWVAIALFVCFGAVALRILWPQAGGTEGFTAVPSALIAEFLEGATAHSLPKMYRELALHGEVAHDVNQERHFTPLTWYFRVAIFLLMAEVVAWVVALVTQ